jgi:hypothetical protein
MPADDPLRADYATTIDLIKTLTDVRFRLLAFVPTISGAAVALLSRGASSAQLIAVGAIGLAATVGVVLYEVRNTQLYDYAVHRAQVLESRLGIVSVVDPSRFGGLYSERPARDVRLFGLALAGHDRALALVYAAAVGGWAYLLAWGVLHAASVGNAQRPAGVIGVVAALAVIVEYLRIDGRQDKSGAGAAPPVAT